MIYHSIRFIGKKSTLDFEFSPFSSNFLILFTKFVLISSDLAIVLLRKSFLENKNFFQTTIFVFERLKPETCDSVRSKTFNTIVLKTGV